MAAKEMTTVELMLHPVRWRLVQALMGRQLTTAELSEQLPEVPTTSLYRQVALLAKHGIVVVVDERRIRGTVERTYALTEAPRLNDEEAAAMGREEHRQAFLQFVTGLLSDFDRYLGRDEINPAEDDVNYAQAALYVSDEELAELGAGMSELLTKYLEDDGSTERRRLMLSTFLLPAD